MNETDGKIKLFVPGRLCLLGEHTDWAGMYRTVNASLEKGYAIVSGIEQGIYAEAERSEDFRIESGLAIYHGEQLKCPMDTAALLKVANEGGFFSYVAGVASYIKDNYHVGGVTIRVTAMDLPVKSGLSSSAAICVLVARAFNRLYKLRMNTKGEMQAAFRGEQRTPSRCGRLDQACAYGVKPVLMEFDGMEIESRELRVGASFTWVIANLMAQKDTIRILGDLNKCYPFAETETDRLVQEALGPDNKELISRAIRCLESGDAPGLGSLMRKAQRNFDDKVAPACKTELTAPVLHSVLSDPTIEKWIYGAKGVGSQGDGTVQFLARDAVSAKELMSYLEKERGMPAFSLTIKPGQAVKRAIIPLAGFGTRMFPATKSLKKGFLPMPDHDGMLKPALLIMLEQLEDAGIEEIALVIGEEDQTAYDGLFAELPEAVTEKLSEEKRAYLRRLAELKEKITYIYQKERLGFGHAVYLCREFTQNEAVLLLLGDMVYRTQSQTNCCRQIMDAYTECGRALVGLQEVPLSRVVHYGILSGHWRDDNDRLLEVETMVEKPTDDYAEEYLGVARTGQEKKYYATFGQYILTSEVFAALEMLLREGKTSGGEYQLTDALEVVRRESGLCGLLVDGDSFDLGLPESYRKAVAEF